MKRRCSECDNDIHNKSANVLTCSKHCRMKRIARLRRKLYKEDKERKLNDK